MKRIISAFAILAGIGLNGCDGDDTTTTPTPNNEIGNGYFPLTQGSEWMYEANDGGTIIPWMERMAGDTVLLGKTYRIREVQREDGSFAKRFFRRSSDSILAPVPSRLREQAGIIERNGLGWIISDTLNNGNTIQSYTNTIKAMGISRTVDGKTYNNIMHLNWISSYTHDGKTSSDTVDDYYAKDIGLIESVRPGYVVTLKSYSIK